VQSPPILLRSGVGPKAELEKLGIPVVHDVPGVGANLIDHPQTFVGLVPKPDVCSMENPVIQIGLRYTAGGSDQFNDMQLYMVSQADMTQLPELMAALGGHPMLFAVMSVLQRPFSRGKVSIASTDFHEHPLIDLNYYEDEDDMRRSLEGVRLCWKVANSPTIMEKAESVVLLTQEVVDDDEALAGYIRAVSSTLYHPVSTCKMGPQSDPGAVVDQHCRVYGLENLRVVDASVMPNIPSANTNLTCIMIGERVADWVKAGA
jgi:choline dehydrogenase